VEKSEEGRRNLDLGSDQTGKITKETGDCLQLLQKKESLVGAILDGVCGHLLQDLTAKEEV